jgi:hypothetical protein
MIDESKHEHLLPSLGLLTIGMGGVAFCAKVIYDTAQMSAGDGSGMQWVVLTPLTLFFLESCTPRCCSATADSADPLIVDSLLRLKWRLRQPCPVLRPLFRVSPTR